MQEGTLSPLWESQVPEHAGVFKDLNACKSTQCIKHEAALFLSLTQKGLAHFWLLMLVNIAPLHHLPS